MHKFSKHRFVSVFDAATMGVKVVNDMSLLVLTTHPMGLWQAIQLMRNVCGIE
jgi:hypothetical protein